MPLGGLATVGRATSNASSGSLFSLYIGAFSEGAEGFEGVNCIGGITSEEGDYEDEEECGDGGH